MTARIDAQARTLADDRAGGGGLLLRARGSAGRQAAPQTRPAGPPDPAASGGESRAASRPESAASETRAESSASRPESSAVQEVVILEVVRENGTALAEASIFLASDTADSVEAKTDARGRAEVAARAGESGRLTISPREGTLPISREIPLDSGTLRLVVPDGRKVAGIVMVGGLPPSEPVKLGLEAEDTSVHSIEATTGRRGPIRVLRARLRLEGQPLVPLHVPARRRRRRQQPDDARRAECEGRPASGRAHGDQGTRASRIASGAGRRSGRPGFVRRLALGNVRDPDRCQGAVPRAPIVRHARPAASDCGPAWNGHAEAHRFRAAVGRARHSATSSSETCGTCRSSCARRKENPLPGRSRRSRARSPGAWRPTRTGARPSSRRRTPA